MRRSEIRSAERRLRKKGATMKEALRLAGLNESTYYRWKQGTRKPLPETIEKFRRAIDLLAPVAVENQP